MKKVFFLLSVVTLLAGCKTYSPVIDPRSVGNEDAYYRDQAECKAIAQQASPGWKDTAKDTVTGGRFLLVATSVDIDRILGHILDVARDQAAELRLHRCSDDSRNSQGGQRPNH